ncbi:MAG: endonuclease/exonuclease/phosphatase family protein [Oligoflexia bacterium]|nr:endonuclease/exonuclease/phosphatase family protein [Oligoflexia bacterium]
MRYEIKILTFNTWHGLDYRHPYLMLPIQGFKKTVERYRSQNQALRAVFGHDKPRRGVLNLCCLQELNPLKARLKTLKGLLNAHGHGAVANAGIRAGYLGIPLFLNEGIATFFRGKLENAKWSSRVLSGKGRRVRGPFGVPLFFQLEERRVALKLRGTFGGLRIAMIQAHLHAGPDTSPKPDSADGAPAPATERRAAEILRLAEWVRPELDRCDLVFIAGDFNNDPDSAETAPLRALGFESPSREFTWCPDENPLCHFPAGGTRTPTDVAWDQARHRFDRIYLWRKPGVIDDTSWECKIQRVLDQGGLSDHFGLMAEISFEKALL